MSKKKDKGYLVFSQNEFHGILEDKEEYERFKEQRDIDNYDVVKLTWKEIDNAVNEGRYNIGRYSTINLLGDRLLFAHEETEAIGFAEEELNGALYDIPAINDKLKTYIKFDDDERQLLNLFTVVFTKVFNDEMENGIFFSEQRQGQLKIEEILDTWLAIVGND